MNKLNNKVIIISLFLFITILKGQSFKVTTFHKDSVATYKKTKLYKEKIEPQIATFNKPSLLKIHNKEVIALTLASTSAWSSFFLRKKADKYYKNYLKYSDPQKIKHNWNKSKKYDHWSEAMLFISYFSTAYLIKRIILN